ncbi:MAG: ABC transporter ATP-binding protein [Longibaculum muris]|uniref:ATP-binding cassette subfamily B protein n=1 Tax=Longibaculum muris TaxID=1796628 RepID=A0A4R3Z809_9FIRM|nr:ABC transporter ATP-binding protein [Longibaculum muris]KXU51810.1 ABC transporter, ATP-binding protein [Candidatus Stoquefichus sp. KLE1796]MBS5369748.1 ABC transporter ATP-binding protein [Coprobacillus cateniformis]MCR1886494.1 ABC transporter ATP-binding protein/permease [Longibaculum muris]MED9811066.1 ABC transporter ATP-binding protein [Longibaculum muris]TCW02709.1 ATP-binding cassette subfamily B protein [Longibaculum muris]
MIKLRKFAYKFWLPILLCIGCVFIQSQSELALPDYMSKIVTNGIQAGGFDSPVADVFSDETFKHLLVFADDEQKKTIESSYTYTSYENLKDNFKEEFPKLKNAYVLNDLSKDEKSQLESALIKPMLMVSSIDSMDKNSKEYQERFGNLPAGMDIYQVFSMMDANTKKEMTKKIDTQIDAMGESTMLIAGGNGVKTEYLALGADVDSIQTRYILSSGLIMLAIALLGSVAAMISAFLSSRVGAGVARDLRKAVFEKVESFSNTEFNKFSTASLITRTTNDITQVQMLMIMLLRIVLFAPMMGVGALYKAITHSTSMTWIILLILLVISGVLFVLIKVVMPKFKIIQSLIDRLNLTMRENLSGVLVIRAFGNEKHSEDRFDRANDDLTKVNLFVNRAMATLMPIMMFIMNIATVLVVWVGAQQLDLGNIAIGDMMAFIQYAMHIIMSFLFIAMIFIMIPRASVAAGRVYEVLSTDLSIKDPDDAKEFNASQKGLVEFKDVTFQYPGAHEAVLSHISFTAEPGKTTAFIGSTGSGKSTLINLIPRFYDVTEGSVTIDGVDVRDVKQHDLRELIGVVPQKGVLFSGTIRSNLQYGAHDASDEELSEVIRIAQAKEFVDDKPKGLSEEISQGGTNVSGGQKQRLAIARALAKNPEILIFDDSFSALDFKTDAILRKELSKLTEKTKNTVLIVGQRIASIMDADQIIVLDKGKIVGKGTHKELMETCQVYQEIAYSQLSKEELADA